MKFSNLLSGLFLSLLFFSCTDSIVTEPLEGLDSKIEVAINDIPFQTDRFYRIPYTLKMWEFEKEGLKLQSVEIFDRQSDVLLLKIEGAELPKIYKDPLTQNNLFTQDKISGYYMSIQVPIPLSESKPAKIYHRFTFRDTKSDKDYIAEGVDLSPRFSETPIAISSPVKGKNWAFLNLSTMDYHFYVLFFKDGKVYRGERFAFDLIQVNDNYTSDYNSAPNINSDYFAYGDTLYAVADGVVEFIQDGKVENKGDGNDAPKNEISDLPGNYLVQNIGSSRFAIYAHCIPNSFLVKSGDNIKEGQPIALLGNSGNSTQPHLHFQITDGKDILFSNGVPFVLKSYTRAGTLESGSIESVKYFNSLVEDLTVLNFD